MNHQERVNTARKDARRNSGLVDGLAMTILRTMTLVALLGIALHLELYWAAGAIVALYLFLRWRFP